MSDKKIEFSNTTLDDNVKMAMDKLNPDIEEYGYRLTLEKIVYEDEDQRQRAEVLKALLDRLGLTTNAIRKVLFSGEPPKLEE